MTRLRDFEGDDAEFDESAEELKVSTDQDGVATLRDVESEAGDEQELQDMFTLDKEEARELGANLDSVDGPEPALD